MIEHPHERDELHEQRDRSSRDRLGLASLQRSDHLRNDDRGRLLEDVGRLRMHRRSDRRRRHRRDGAAVVAGRAADHGGHTLRQGPRPRRTEVGERHRELSHVPKPRRGRLLQASDDDRLQRRRRVRTQRSQGSRGGGRDLHRHLGHRLAAEGRLPGDELVEDDAQRPDVRAVGHVPRGAHLLRRHVHGRAHHRRSSACARRRTRGR